MKIKTINDLKNFIEKILDVIIDARPNSVNANLPQPLQIIYTIDAFFATHNCAYETLRFFRNMDRLTLYQNLQIQDKQFVFATENQGNWYAKTSLLSDKVYIYNHEEILDGTALDESLEDFLITFALLEISNNFKHFCGLYENSLKKINKQFRKSEPLWVNKKYLLRTTSFYLVDDDVLFDEANNTIATNNEEKFNYYRSKLETYLYN